MNNNERTPIEATESTLSETLCIDIEKEIMSTLAQEITYEIDRELFRIIRGWGPSSCYE